MLHFGVFDPYDRRIKGVPATFGRPTRIDGWRRLVSPILVRPVREQLEHDRIIRLLQAKYRRKYDAAINPGTEQNAPVGSGAAARYPDLVLSSLERGHRLQAVVEVETGESVNHLEALAQWSHLSKLRVPFHLYVPSSMMDVARRLCEDNHIHAAEMWSYHTVVDDVRFALVHRSRLPVERPAKARTPTPPRRKAPAAKPKRVARRAKPAKRASKPVRRASKRR